MKKNSAKGYAVLGILFVLISVVAFVVPTAKTAAFWIAYGFTVVAFAAQLFIWKIALEREETMKSKFLGFPVVYIGAVYLVIQVVALAVFLFVSALPAWSAVVACAVITGVSAVCMIASDAGRSEIERVDTKIQKKTFYIKQLQTEVELLADTETDTAIKSALGQLAEKIRFSDPVSHEQLAGLESRITEKMIELKAAVDKTEVVAELHSLLDERNKKCKMLK